MARKSGRHRTIWLAAFVAFALACLGFWGLSVRQDRTATLRDATARTAATADLLREHAARAIEAGDHIVRALAYLAAGWDLRDEEAGRRIWEEMRERVADSPQTASAWILDAKGDAVMDTGDYPTKPGSFAHRDYYRAHLGAGRGLFIGAAETGTTSGRPRFTLSRAIRAGDGGLKGVAVAGVYSDYFAAVYGEAGLPPDAVLALLTAEGGVLAEWPIDETPAADDLSVPVLLAYQATAPAGAFTAEGPGGGARLVAWRTLADRPLIVAVGIPVAGALAEWRARTWRSGTLAFAGLGGFALLVATGVAAARREAAAHGESEARLRLALQAGRMGVWDRDADTGTVRWDAAQYEICGMDPREPPLMGDAFFDRLVHPDDREGVRRAMEAAVREGRDYAHEFRIVRPDGEVRWLAGRGTIIRGGMGRSGRMIGVNYDITDRKRSEEQRELLLAELNHRIRNAFSVVQALAAQTFRHGGQDLREIERAFLDRLAALARVSTLVTTGDGADGVDLRALAEAVVEPHRRDDGNPRLSGPAVALPAPVARTLSLALHELATNAAKYGSLSVPDGRVELAWRVAGDGEEPHPRRRLVLEWTERGGPPVRPPARRGVGRVLIEQAVAHELDGTVRLEFPPDGVRCRIELPLDA